MIKLRNKNLVSVTVIYPSYSIHGLSTEFIIGSYYLIKTLGLVDNYDAILNK